MTENRGQRTDGGSGGFSLIEIIITLVVLSIAAAGVLSVFLSSSKASGDPLVLNQAVQLAQEKMDIIIGDRKNPARGFAWIVPANYPNDNVTLTVGGRTYARAVSIVCVDSTDLNADPGPGCPQNFLRVTVTVSWTLDINTVSVNATTLFANYGAF